MGGDIYTVTSPVTLFPFSHKDTKGFKFYIDLNS